MSDHDELLRRLDVLIGAIYELSGVGCCLHVVLDDGNWQRENVQWCIDNATHGTCKEVGELLLRLSDEERKSRLTSARPFMDFKNPLSSLV